MKIICGDSLEVLKRATRLNEIINSYKKNENTIKN